MSTPPTPQQAHQLTPVFDKLCIQWSSVPLPPQKVLQISPPRTHHLPLRHVSLSPSQLGRARSPQHHPHQRTSLSHSLILRSLHRYHSRWSKQSYPSGRNSNPRPKHPSHSPSLSPYPSCRLRRLNRAFTLPPPRFPHDCFERPQHPTSRSRLSPQTTPPSATAPTNFRPAEYTAWASSSSGLSNSCSGPTASQAISRSEPRYR